MYKLTALPTKKSKGYVCVTVLDVFGERKEAKKLREREKERFFWAGWGANAALGKWGTHVCAHCTMGPI